MTKSEFNVAFEAFRPQLRSYVLRITASVLDTDDILQDTWLKAMEKLDTFKGESSIKTWVFAIASNLTRDNHRAKKRWVEDVTDVCKEMENFLKKSEV